MESLPGTRGGRVHQLWETQSPLPDRKLSETFTVTSTQLCVGEMALILRIMGGVELHIS